MTCDGFADWLEAMHPRLMGFVDFQLPPLGVRADYSRESLAELEAALLRRWTDEPAFKRDRDTEFVDGVVRYIGECLLRAFGGGWACDDDPNALAPGQPTVVLDMIEPVPSAPLFLVAAMVRRRTGQVLTRIWDGQMLNLDDQRALHGPDWQPSRAPVPGLTSGTGARRAASPELEQWLARVSDLVPRDVPQPAAATLAALETEILADLGGRDPAELGEAATIEAYVARFGEILIGSAGGEWGVQPGPRDGGPRNGWPYVERVRASGEVAVNRPLMSIRGLVRSGAPGALVEAWAAYAE